MYSLPMSKSPNAPENPHLSRLVSWGRGSSSAPPAIDPLQGNPGGRHILLAAGPESGARGCADRMFRDLVLGGRDAVWCERVGGESLAAGRMDAGNVRTALYSAAGGAFIDRNGDGAGREPAAWLEASGTSLRILILEDHEAGAGIPAPIDLGPMLLAILEAAIARHARGDGALTAFLIGILEMGNSDWCAAFFDALRTLRTTILLLHETDTVDSWRAGWDRFFLERLHMLPFKPDLAAGQAIRSDGVRVMLPD